MDPGSPELEQLRQQWLSSPVDLRRGKRQPLFEPLPAWLQAAGEDSPSIRADVVDHSPGGLCLALSNPCALQPGDRLALTLIGQGGETGVGPERRQVRVCWREETAQIVAVGVAYDDT